MKLVPALFLLLAPLLTSCSELYRPVDCSDIRQQDNSSPSGVYTIYPLGERSAVQVYCDMDSSGGGWTVFQRRMDGTVNFYRPWDYYKFGFGDPAGEYWLGLDNIYYLTNQRKYEYGYKLQVSGFSDGGAAWSFTMDRSSPPLTKTKTFIPETVPDFTWEGSGTKTVCYSSSLCPSLLVWFGFVLSHSPATHPYMDFLFPHSPHSGLITDSFTSSSLWFISTPQSNCWFVDIIHAVLCISSV
ncbi:microfibril-associated glycoprotein 4-like isoform X4 [Anabas testudineus]|uniref:Fibrinogen C-terminal domain-containing protein n=2 Tax=Anabas testudineus TaxID=64144 RepID=A0AAQ6IMV5_ANATE|nr:microfibril-associated glycoprotein 4-like isoform X4 [Anabas testudineus]